MISFVTDVIGAVPGEGQAFAAAQIASGGAGLINSLATGNQENAGWNGASAVGSIVGIQIAVVDQTSTSLLGKGLPKLIPGIGNFYSGVFAVHDVYQGIIDYRACLKEVNNDR